VAAFNIISTVVMLVKDKRRDIRFAQHGRDSGVHPAHLFPQRCLLGVSGTVLGVVLGVLFANNIESIRQFLSSLTGTNLFAAEIYFLSQLPAKIEWDEVRSVVWMAGSPAPLSPPFSPRFGRRAWIRWRRCAMTKAVLELRGCLEKAIPPRGDRRRWPGASVARRQPGGSMPGKPSARTWPIGQRQVHPAAPGLACWINPARGAVAGKRGRAGDAGRTRLRRDAIGFARSVPPTCCRNAARWKTS
jgi:hypothetical protein